MNGPLTLPGNQCVVHGYHWPSPTRTVRHHVWPKEWGGPDTEANLVNVCDTGHYNIHAYMYAVVGGRAVPKITRKERQLAEQGLEGYWKKENT